MRAVDVLAGRCYAFFHIRTSARHVSTRDAELDAQIMVQDRMLLAARAEGVSPKFVARLIAQRNDLAREQVAEWRRSEWERPA